MARLCIRQVSGAMVAELDAQELQEMVQSGQTIRNLKQRLAGQIGCSRFRQRLLGESGELQDDLPLTSWTSLQLVVLDFSPPSPRGDLRFLTACAENCWPSVERMLQRPQDPNVRDSRGSALSSAAEKGCLEVVQLLLEAGWWWLLAPRSRKPTVELKLPEFSDRCTTVVS